MKACFFSAPPKPRVRVRIEGEVTDETETMMERVARAMARSAGGKMTGPGQSAATREMGWKGDGAHLDQYVEVHYREWLHAAGFAIAAMRGPTPEMVLAAVTKAAQEQVRPVAVHIADVVPLWDAMIDEALAHG